MPSNSLQFFSREVKKKLLNISMKNIRDLVVKMYEIYISASKAHCKHTGEQNISIR